MKIGSTQKCITDSSSIRLPFGHSMPDGRPIGNILERDLRARGRGEHAIGNLQQSGTKGRGCLLLWPFRWRRWIVWSGIMSLSLRRFASNSLGVGQQELVGLRAFRAGLDGVRCLPSPAGVRTPSGSDTPTCASDSSSLPRVAPGWKFWDGKTGSAHTPSNAGNRPKRYWCNSQTLNHILLDFALWGCGLTEDRLLIQQELNGGQILF